MTEKKKKPETKKASTTQRYSDVAKELGLEVKALLALADQFVEAHPDFKEPHLRRRQEAVGLEQLQQVLPG